MICTTNKLQINGEWHDILIVQSETPVTFAHPSCITDGNVLYFTDGDVFKSEQQGDKYYYWFVIERQETHADPEMISQETANTQELLELDYRITLTENGVKESDLK